MIYRDLIFRRDLLSGLVAILFFRPDLLRHWGFPKEVAFPKRIWSRQIPARRPRFVATLLDCNEKYGERISMVMGESPDLFVTGHFCSPDLFVTGPFCPRTYLSPDILVTGLICRRTLLSPTYLSPDTFVTGLICHRTFLSPTFSHGEYLS